MAITEDDLRQSLPGDDDMSGQFLEHRERLAQATAANELLGRIRTNRAQQTTETPEEQLTREAVQRGQIPPDRVGAGEREQGVGRGVVRDVARGVVEIPRAVAAGARDAVQATLDMVQTE